MANVEWGEFKIGDLFEVESYKKRFDSNKVQILKNGKFPYVVRMSSNNGHRGFIDEDETYLNDGNTISFGQDTATMYYQEFPYFTGDKIKIVKAKDKRFNKKNAQFFLSTMAKSFSSFSWGASSFHVKIIKNQKITLPILDNNEINFEFMDSFIATLEAERMTKLKAYLSAANLTDYTLSTEEQKALDNFEQAEFKEFKVTDIFDVNNSKSILSRDIIADSGTTPYLCASADNNAVSTYIAYDKQHIDTGNCVFIGGKTFVVTYQEHDFYSNDSHNLILHLKDVKKHKSNQLYLATCIKKGLSHKYSWGDSISNRKIQKDTISLPVTNKKPDYAMMETLISAIQKLVIKDVVLYVNDKMQTPCPPNKLNNSPEASQP